MSSIPSLNLSHVQIHKPQAIGAIRRLFTPLGDNDYILEMDWSSIDHFLACWRKSEFALVYSRVSGRSAALTYGSAIHLALEQYYRGETDPEKIMVAGMPEFEANPPSLSEWRNIEKYRETITKYIAKYSKDDSFTIDKLGDTLMVEQPFSTPLCELEINDFIPYDASMLLPAGTPITEGKLFIRRLFVQWTGVIDLLIRDGSDQSRGIVDHKTTSIGGPTYYDGFDLTQQFRGYCWAATKISGEPVLKAMANVIEGRKPTKTGVSLEFQRKWITYLPEKISTWETDMKAIIADFMSKLVKGHFPENTHSCVGKYGKCEYFDVCRLEQKLQLHLLNTDIYTNNVWNPLT